jgi:hypothetical protein
MDPRHAGALLVGETFSQADVPAEAENATGPSVVVNVTVCGATGGDAAENVSEVGFMVNVGKGSVTISFTFVTPAVPGGTAAAGAKVTDAVYVPASSPVGFEYRTTLAGKFPEDALSVSHSAVVVVPVGAMVAV